MSGKSPRRWLRFSLRTLLVCVTLMCVWLGWLVNAAKQQKASIDAVRQFGGWIYYDFQVANGKADPKATSSVPEWLLARLGYDYFHNVVEVNLVYSYDIGRRQDNSNLTDKALAHLGGFPKLRTLLLSNTQANDDSLRYVGELGHLEELYMWDVAEVTDAGIARLSNLKHLTYLHCSNSQITDESLLLLATFPRLTGLCLEGHRFSDKGLSYVKDMVQLTDLLVGIPSGGNGAPTRGPISDDGLLYVRNLTNLKMLDLQYTQVTSQGLKNLEGLENLKDLWLQGSAVTDISEIQKALPKCTITR